MRALTKLLAGVVLSVVCASSAHGSAARRSESAARVRGFGAGGLGQIYMPASAVAQPSALQGDTYNRSYVTVTLVHPADAEGQLVFLSYQNASALVNPPRYMWVYGGDWSSTIVVTPRAVPFNMTVTITATAAGGSVSTTLNIRQGASVYD